MSGLIKSINIKNFRSVVQADVSDLSDLNVFVGKNDQGKSNILRALNLFFNGTPEPGRSMEFERDFSLLAKVSRRKAREITVRIGFEVPDTYEVKGLVYWTRKWRVTGLHEDVIKNAKGEALGARSRIPALLRAIRYHYVPAIKGTDYFRGLLGDLHDTLAETVEDEMRKASSDFTAAIKANTKSILHEIEKRLAIVSSIEMPSNLRELFSTLDFQAAFEGRLLSLSQRGDGIKVRHIPILLHWFHNQGNLNRQRGSIPLNSVWGYEEPENNLELSSALALSEQLRGYCKDVQILITTHSPAFYGLGNGTDGASLHLVSKCENGVSRVTDLRPDSEHTLDEDLGLLPFITPYVAKAQQEREQLLQNIEELKKDEAATLFVEGKTDAQILAKAWQVLGDKGVQFNVRGPATDDPDFGGCGWVGNMLIGWAHFRKKEKALGLLDADAAGKAACNRIRSNEEVKTRSDRVNARLLTPPLHISEISKKGIELSYGIEEMFPLAIWRQAEAKGWLQDRRAKELLDLNHFFSFDETFVEHCKGRGLTDDQTFYVRNQIRDGKKQAFADFVTSLKGAELEEAFQPFTATITKLADFFKPKNPPK